MKCPKTRKCPKIDCTNLEMVLKDKQDKRPYCKKCNHGKDIKEKKIKNG